MTFEELEHTADVRMRITASTLPELFVESGFALAEVSYGMYEKEPANVFFPIEAEGKGIVEKIVNFLSELLFLFDTEYFVPVSFDIVAEGSTVNGTVAGVLFDRAKHANGIGVKGVSYSDISLAKTVEGYELIIIFDI